jgi:two-component system, OmpR family, response regulator
MTVRVQTAMIIDDDVDFSKLLTTILERRKIHVLAVHTLQEAEDYLANLKPSVIFLDNSFPEGLGINFIQHIKSIDERIKIIMMTGDTSSWIRQKAIEEGINYFLPKPLSRQMIDKALDELKFRKAEL